MRNFEIFFDDAEPSLIDHPAYTPYGKLGLPAPQAERPWILANFVQSIDGVASFKGPHAAGADISQSVEDRWLMDLLRAQADAIIMAIDPNAYRVFDGDQMEAFILTTAAGAARLQAAGSRAQVIVAGLDRDLDLAEAMRKLRLEMGIEYLLCEGGPTFYGSMARAGLIDEKFVTVSPVEIGLFAPAEQGLSGAGNSLVNLRPTTFMFPGFMPQNVARYRWLSCRRVGGHQFHRYRRK